MLRKYGQNEMDKMHAMRSKPHNVTVKRLEEMVNIYTLLLEK